MTFNNIAAGDPGNAAPVMQNFKHVNYGNNLIPVDSNGTGTNNTLDFGSTSFRWANTYSVLGNFSGAITGATATDTINGLVINSGALSGITTLNMSGNLTVDTNTFFVDATKNAVGIGTTIPESIQSGFTTLRISGLGSVNVDGSAAGSGIYIGNNVYRDSVDSRWEYIAADEASQYLQANGTHEWRYAGLGSANGAITWSTAMYIDNSGNVGIGTSSPLHKLDIVDATDPHLRLRESTTGVNLEMFSTSTAGWVGTQSNHDLRLITNDTTKVTIDTNGNVGIGTASVLTNQWDGVSTSIYDATNRGLLFIGSSDSADNQNLGIFGFTNADNSDASAATSKLTAYITAITETSDSNAGDDSGSHLDFYTKPEAGSLANRMRIDSEGNVGIGTTGPDRKVDVLDASNPQLRLTQAGGTKYLDMQYTSGDIFKLTRSLDTDYIQWSGSTNTGLTMYTATGGGATTIYSPSGITVDDDRHGQGWSLNLTCENTSGTPVNHIFAFDPDNTRFSLTTNLIFKDNFTENFEFKDAGSTSATEQDWIEVDVGGVTGYIRVYATK